MATVAAARHSTLDVKTLREDFPILTQRIHGKPLVYLDNAATTQKPQAVIDRIVKYYSEENSNVHRGVHHLSEVATLAYENARTSVQRFINARSPDEIIFTRGTTESVNLVAQTWGPANLRMGDQVLLTSGAASHDRVTAAGSTSGRTRSRCGPPSPRRTWFHAPRRQRSGRSRSRPWPRRAASRSPCAS